MHVLLRPNTERNAKESVQYRAEFPGEKLCPVQYILYLSFLH